MNTRAKMHGKPQPWPTPNTLDSLPQRSQEARERQLRRGDPTGPRRTTSGKSNDLRGRGIQDRPLNEQAVFFSQQSEATTGMTGSQSEDETGLCGLLNPEFVSSLMGFEIGYLQLEP